MINGMNEVFEVIDVVSRFTVVVKNMTTGEIINYYQNCISVKIGDLVKVNKYCQLYKID